MRRSITLIALCILAPAVTFGDDVEVLREFKTVLWPQAYRTQDVELLDRLLHDSFEMIDADGNRSTKQEELEYIRNNQWDPGRFEYRIERLQTYQGLFAVIDGTGIAEAYTYKSSNFLVKENGVWRAIASHVSGFQSTVDPQAEACALPRTKFKAGIESHEIFGVYKLGFTTANLDATFTALNAAGVEVFFPIVAASDGNRTFGMKDSEGNIIQFLGE